MIALIRIHSQQKHVRIIQESWKWGGLPPQSKGEEERQKVVFSTKIKNNVGLKVQWQHNEKIMCIDSR